MVHYGYPVYWTLPNDGAAFKCCDCQKYFHHTKVILTQTPNGKRAVICLDCVDDDWKANAKYLGEAK